jgi:hypothetical protein
MTDFDDFYCWFSSDCSCDNVEIISDLFVYMKLDDGVSFELDLGAYDDY